MSSGDLQQKKGIRKTVLVLTVVALAFYLGIHSDGRIESVVSYA